MINKDNREKFLIFAAKNTKTNHFMSLTAFQEELSRIKFIKRGLVRYNNNKQIILPELIANFVILNNIFYVYPLNQLLFADISEEYWSDLKTILFWLGILTNDKTLKLPTEPQVLIKLNNIKINKKLYKELDDEVSKLYRRKN